MSPHRTLSRLTLLSALVPAGVGAPAEERGSLRLRIAERGADGRLVPAPARVHLADGRGRPVLAPGLPAFRDHFNADGEVRLDLDPGPYTYTVERGPEYNRASGRLEVAAGAVRAHAVELGRATDLAARGWYSADADGQRRPE